MSKILDLKDIDDFSGVTEFTVDYRIFKKNNELRYDINKMLVLLAGGYVTRIK